MAECNWDLVITAIGQISILRQRIDELEEIGEKIPALDISKIRKNLAESLFDNEERLKEFFKDAIKCECGITGVKK